MALLFLFTSNGAYRFDFYSLNLRIRLIDNDDNNICYIY